MWGATSHLRCCLVLLVKNVIAYKKIKHVTYKQRGNHPNVISWTHISSAWIRSVIERVIKWPNNLLVAQTDPTSLHHVITNMFKAGYTDWSYAISSPARLNWVAQTGHMRLQHIVINMHNQKECGLCLGDISILNINRYLNTKEQYSPLYPTRFSPEIG